jgi:hypothetical protein
MGATLIRAYSGQPGAASGTLYASPANSRMRILAATVTNEGTTGRYISFHLVPVGDTASNANIILNQKIIGSKESYSIPELLGHVLEPGDFISSIAEAADELTVHISGVIMT